MREILCAFNESRSKLFRDIPNRTGTSSLFTLPNSGGAIRVGATPFDKIAARRGKQSDLPLIQ